MFELHATTREAGKKLGTLRQEKQVPGVLYGPGVEPLTLAFSRKDFQRAFDEAGESSLLRLIVDDTAKGGTHVVLIRDVQRDPVRGFPTHSDFHAVRLDEEIKIDIPLNFIGSSSLETRGEGTIVKDMHEIEVEAFPEKLPHEIDVDISGMETVDAELRVRDLQLPDGVRAVSDEDLVVVHAAPLMSEAEIASIEEPSEEAVGEVEVVGEKKEEDTEPEAEDGKEAAPPKE